MSVRRTLLALAVTAAAFVGFGAPTAQAYPPTPRTVTATPSSGGPAYEVTVAATCTPGESITFRLVDAQATADCLVASHIGLLVLDENLAGVATVELEAPMTPGDHRGHVTGTSNSVFGSFTITVLPPNNANSSVIDAPRLGADVTTTTAARTWWPPLFAMGAVMSFAIYALQRPLQLSPRR